MKKLLFTVASQLFEISLAWESLQGITELQEVEGQALQKQRELRQEQGCFYPAFYYDEVVAACLPCPKGCEVCSFNQETSSSSCSSCSKGFTTPFNSDQCVEICFGGTFFDESLNVCHSCPSGCQSCLWDWETEIFQCMACLPGLTLTSDAKRCLNMTCPTGLIFDEQEERCVRCQDKACEACVWNYPEKESRCVRCNQNFTLSSFQDICIYDTRKQECSDGFYWDEEGASCFECPPLCKSCTKTELDDLICHSCFREGTYHSDFQLCEADCTNDQYFDFNHNFCFDCPPGCSRCHLNLVGKVTCTKCGFGFKNILERCYKDCNPGQMFNPDSGRCEVCQHGCQGCYYNENSGSQQCYTCQWDDSFSQTFHSCEASCGDNQYFDFIESLACQSCPSTCQNCSLSWEKGLQCQSCSFFKVPNQYGQCLNDGCQEEEVWDENFGCTTCREATTYDPVLRKCVPDVKCKESEYLNDTLQCEACIEGCEYCNEKDICLGCSQGYILQQNGTCLTRCPEEFFSFSERSDSCYLDCPSNFFPTPDYSSCLPCLDRCSACHNISYCTDCRPEFWLTEQNECERICIKEAFLDKERDVCDLNCQDGQFKNLDIFECERCPEGCTTCDNSSFCSFCEVGYRKEGQDDLCHSICNHNNTFWNAKTQQCEEFLVCPRSNQFLNLTINECYQCPEGCLECLSNASCVRCKQTWALENGTCYSRCKDNFYVWSPEKQECIPSLICPSKQYLDLDLRLCLSCGKNCIDCNSSIECNACSDPIQMDIDKGQCLFHCPDLSTYLEPQTGSCLQKCEGNYYYNEDDGECEFCRDGWFFDQKKNRCLECPEGCKVCDSEDSCISCEEDRYKDWNSGECVEYCPDEAEVFNVEVRRCESKCSTSERYSYQQKECIPCSRGCSHCTEDGCLFCQWPKYEMTDFGYCLDVCAHDFMDYNEQEGACITPECQSGYYFNETLRQCTYCLLNCTQCSEVGQCDTCRYPKYKQYLLWSEQYIIDPNDQSTNKGPFLCLDYCGEEGLIYVEATKTCEVEVTSCPKSTTYYDPYWNKCLSCSLQCLSCTSSTECTQCNEPRYVLHTYRGTTYCADACTLQGKIWVQGSQQCEDPVECTEPSEYPDYDHNICRSCYHLCATCSNAWSCDTYLLSLPLDGEIDFSGSVSNQTLPQEAEERNGRKGAWIALMVALALMALAMFVISFWVVIAKKRKRRLEKEEIKSERNQTKTKDNMMTQS